MQFFTSILCPVAVTVTDNGSDGDGGSDDGGGDCDDGGDVGCIAGDDTVFAFTVFYSLLKRHTKMTFNPHFKTTRTTYTIIIYLSIAPIKQLPVTCFAFIARCN